MSGRRVLVTGATGFLGGHITRRLEQRGDEVVVVSRTPGDGRVHWEWQKGEIDKAAIGTVDAVVHLAGESIAGLWTNAKKRAIRESRRMGTLLIAQASADLDPPPKVFVSSSAIGYYGDRGDEVLDEDESNGAGFLAEVVRSWEDSAQPARDAGIRTVNLRLGLVLGPDGGLLSQIKPLFRFGAGGKIASGKQWWSWVSVDDVANAFLKAIDDESLEGQYNVAAPEPVTNAEFTKALGRVMHRPTMLPAPKFALKAVMRDMADETMLASQRIDSAKLRQTGFEFGDTELEATLRRYIES